MTAYAVRKFIDVTVRARVSEALCRDATVSRAHTLNNWLRHEAIFHIPLSGEPLDFNGEWIQAIVAMIAGVIPVIWNTSLNSSSPMAARRRHERRRRVGLRYYSVRTEPFLGGTRVTKSYNADHRNVRK